MKNKVSSRMTQLLVSNFSFLFKIIINGGGVYFLKFVKFKRNSANSVLFFFCKNVKRYAIYHLTAFNSGFFITAKLTISCLRDVLNTIIELHPGKNAEEEEISAKILNKISKVRE